MKTKIEKKEQKSNLYSKREEKEKNWENGISLPEICAYVDRHL